MAPVKSSKPADYNPWSWTSTTLPENISEEHLLLAYRVKGFPNKCSEIRRNCKRNPYCVWGLGEKKWKEDNEGDEDDDGTAFRTEGEYAGLQNLGATCYVNSLLQLWFHNPIFRPAILKWSPTRGRGSGEDAIYKPGCPLAQLQAIFARMKISKKSKIDPSDFVSSLLLNTGEQQDAQEFAKLFMDYIVNLLKNYGDEQIRNLIAQSFDGKLQYETECLGCKNKSSRSEGFTELNLRVMKNLNESLDDLLADETLSDEYMCSNCRKKTTAIRRMQLLSLPPVLNLQLLRFVYDREAQRRKKVTQNISFPEVLEMQPRIHRRNSNDSSSQYRYHLTAVLIHNGQSASSGHYVAQIKDLRNGEWLKFNDEFVDTVSKGKNQKSKDDDEDDTEKKSKSKKTKNSPSLTSSGAYMLVYTLDKYIKSPEPDPELHEYLTELVKREDASFEEEVYKTKNEKDFEISVKVRRRNEVEWLYEFGKASKSKSESDTSAQENVDEPKAKVPRYENAVSVDSKKKEVTNDTTMNGNGKTNGCGSYLPARKSSYENGELDFISVDWMSQWLDGGNPVPPIENAMLCCPHKKLAPPQPNSTPCLYRIIPTPLADFLFETYQGAPRFRISDLCLDCVKAQCEKLRKLSELEEDSKRVSEIIKKCDSEYTTLMKTGSLPDSFRKDKCWINRESAKSWKKTAKNRIEMPSSMDPKEADEQDAETMEVDTENLAFNATVLCEHGALSPDESNRKIIPLEAFKIIQKHFDDAFELSAEMVETCNECVDAKHAHTAATQMTKDLAGQQRQALLDLYHDRNRPDTKTTGLYYVVSTAFVADWRQFIRDPTRSESVSHINNETLFCEHGKFKYPLDYVSEFLKEAEDADDVVCLLTSTEWKYISQNFQCDKEIKINVAMVGAADEIQYTPETCIECAESWLKAELSKRYSYQEGHIYVVRRDKGENLDSDDEEPSKTDTTILSTKREVKPVNRDAWMSGCTSNSTVRRSGRPRTGKTEKTYKVSSKLTVKELKAKICADFKAMLSDQHLFFNGTELEDITKTLGELKIPTRAKLFLEIDTAVNGKVDDPVSTVETGFQGTLLIGGTGFGDNRSPVQNF